MKQTHITIINQSIDFIIDHLYEKLTIDMIADHCRFSRYYFNRLFKSVTGENLYGFIKRIRIETAAFKLIKFPHQDITSIAGEIGYSSSNFTVLFKEHFGVPPSLFRKAPALPPEPVRDTILKKIRKLQDEKPEELLKAMDKRITLEIFPEIILRYTRFKGNYHDLHPFWEKFCREQEILLKDSQPEFYGISYDDPIIAGETRCLYDLCVRVTETPERAVRNYRKIRGGRYICYSFHEPLYQLSEAFMNLFAVWMPHRGYIMGQGLCLERYRSGLKPDGTIELDICVPII